MRTHKLGKRGWVDPGLLPVGTATRPWGLENLLPQGQSQQTGTTAPGWGYHGASRDKHKDDSWPRTRLGWGGGAHSRDSSTLGGCLQEGKDYDLCTNLGCHTDFRHRHGGSEWLRLLFIAQIPASTHLQSQARVGLAGTCCTSGGRLCTATSLFCSLRLSPHKAQISGRLGALDLSPRAQP